MQGWAPRSREPSARSASSGSTRHASELAALVGEARADELVERYVPLVPGRLRRAELAGDRRGRPRPPRRTAPSGPGAIDTDDAALRRAAPDEWRFRVYRRGAPLALADLLPLLDQLGFRALDERSFSSVSTTA